jgi:hemolysin activation/secretion protein
MPREPSLSKRKSVQQGRCLLVAGLLAWVSWAGAVDGAAPSLAVERFRVSGNTLLAPGLIEATLAPFKGQRTLEELRQAAEAVQRLYAEAGWGGVIAYLPPQNSEDGTVALTVIEGKLASVTVKGAKSFTDEQVRASLPDLAVGTTPRMRRIDSQIEIGNENPARRVQALLKPGARPGEIAAELTVQDKPLQGLTASLDDTGNSRTGRYRAGFTWQHANLTGHDDVLTGQYQTSPSQPSKVTVLSAGYRFPLPAQLAVLEGYLAYSDVDAGASSTAAGDVRINGRGNLGGIRGTAHLPRLGETDQRLALALDRREYINQCEVGGLPSGACGSASATVSVTPLTLEYSARAAGPPSWGVVVSALANLGFGGRHADSASFDAVRPGAKSGWSAVRSAANFNLPFAQSWLLRGRLALQWTGDALVSGEQFGLGGAGAVRGYEEREVVGDRGLLASLEVVAPEWLERPRPDSPSLRSFAFVDAGVASNLLGAPCNGDRTRCSLSSVGLGLASEGRGLQARIAAAVALQDGTLTRRHDARVHVSLLYAF